MSVEFDLQQAIGEGPTCRVFLQHCFAASYWGIPFVESVSAASYWGSLSFGLCFVPSYLGK